MRSNVAEPIEVSVLPLANVTEVKSVAARKTANPIVVTVFGIVAEVTPEL